MWSALGGKTFAIKTVRLQSRRESGDVMNKAMVVLVSAGLMVVVGAQVAWADEEADLIAVLKSGAGVVEKCDACLRLRVSGTARSVAALEAALEGDERLSHAARHALEGMACAEAGEALRRALGRTDGLRRVGIIDSLGHRGEAASVGVLKPLPAAGDSATASAAAAALGQIGGAEATAALWAVRDTARPGVGAAVLDGLLGCAEAALAAGDRSAAMKVYADLAGESRPGAVRAAAWRGLVTADAAGRAERMVAGLRSGDGVIRRAALRLVRELDDATAIRACADRWAELGGDARLAVLDAQVRAGVDAEGAIRRAAVDADAGVRVAALEAAGVVGGAGLVPLLAAAAAEGGDAERAAARGSLERLAGPGVEAALVAGVKAGSETVRAELIRALGRRGATAAADRLMGCVRDRSAVVRRAALEALGRIGGVGQIEPLVDLAAQSAVEQGQTDREADAIIGTLAAVAKRCGGEDRAAELALERYARARGAARGVLVRALGRLGSARGLETLRAALTQRNDAGLRRAALGAAADWPNDALVGDLLAVARGSEQRVEQVLALRAAIGGIERSGASAEAKVRQLEQVMKAAQRAAEKRAALAVLAKMGTAEALEAACARLGDGEVRTEAAQAALQIGEAIKGTSAREVAEAMRQVAAATEGAQKERAEALLLEVESIASYVTEWEAAGPYMQEGKNYAVLFDVPFGPEVPGAEVAWKPIGVEASGGHPAYVDLLKAFGGEQRVAYLRTRIEAEQAGPARLELYTDDGVKAWLNGALVYANNAARPIPAEPDVVSVSLKAGVNVLMLKVTQNNLPWGAVVRVRRAKGADGPRVGSGWRLHVINAESRFEAGTIMDVNRDGRLDILCGGFWYEAPGWKRHFVREIQEAGGYHYDFANLPMDVDGDGWTDTVGAAWHNKMVYWVRNPGPAGGAWPVYEVDVPGNMETAIAVDIDGDGRQDVLPNIMTAAAWYSFEPDKAAPNGVRWTKHALPKAVAGHGIGAGDVNGDGRCDVVGPKGWLEQEADGAWTWHAEFELGAASIPILVHDVDGDGDADVIWGMGHNYGIYWLEQGREAGGERTWVRHTIDESWSQAHFPLLADLDGDGATDLVTGKRYHAHNGHDPGGNDPVCVYYYTFDRETKRWRRHVLHEGGQVGFGINTAAVDIDGDGDVDVLAPGKSGLYLLENLRR